MRDDPRLDPDLIASALAAHHGVDGAEVAFLPVGYDVRAAAYRVVGRDGASRFLKVRFGPWPPGALAVSRALADRGVPGVLAPLPTRDGALAFPLAGLDASAACYPFVVGRDAAEGGMSDAQWRDFGAALRAVHDSGLDARLRDVLPTEAFDLPSAALAREIGREVASGSFAGVAARFAAWWRAHADRIDALIGRAESLGRALRARSLPTVLCHADIHAANVLVGDDGRVWLADWDAPRIAPRERDLLFVVGSTIARHVAPGEERAFFAGYGPVPVDPDALVYFRLERIVEDLGSFGETILRDPAVSEATRADAARVTAALLAPGSDLDRAERVDLSALGG